MRTCYFILPSILSIALGLRPELASGQPWSQLQGSRSVFDLPAQNVVADADGYVFIVNSDSGRVFARINEAGEIVGTRKVDAQTFNYQSNLVSDGSQAYVWGNRFDVRPAGSTITVADWVKDREIFGARLTSELRFEAEVVDTPSARLGVLSFSQQENYVDESNAGAIGPDGHFYQFIVTRPVDSVENSFLSTDWSPFAEFRDHDFASGELRTREYNKDPQRRYRDIVSPTSLVATDSFLYVTAYYDGGANSSRNYGRLKLNFDGDILSDERIPGEIAFPSTPRLLRSEDKIYESYAEFVSPTGNARRTNLRRYDTNLRLELSTTIPGAFHLGVERSWAPARDGGFYAVFANLDRDGRPELRRVSPELGVLWTIAISEASLNTQVISARDGGVILVWSSGSPGTASIWEVRRFSAGGQLVAISQRDMARESLFAGPNPVRDALRVSEQAVSEQLTIEFRTLSGQLAFARTLDASMVELSEVLPKGAFVATLRNTAGELIESKTFVRQ